MTKNIKRIIVGITGASGSIYGVRLLESLKKLGIESHLIVTKAGLVTLTQETDYTLKDLENLASFSHNIMDISAAISSGSFRTDGMIISPCSIRAMSSIASSISSDLLVRAADVCLKEQRKLVLMVRETPLHLGHLENMTKLSRMGAIIAPPVPAFYNKPANLDDIVNHSIGRVLDLFGLDNGDFKRWKEA